MYSWIAHHLDIGRILAFLLSMSGFKSETSFGFLIENYTGHVLWTFVKPQIELVWPVFAFWKRCFQGVLGTVLVLFKLKIDFYWVKLSYSWIGHGLQSGPTLACSLWLSKFKTMTSFGFLIKKFRGRFFFFEKSKNELVWPKTMFLVILAKIRSFSNNSDM